VEEAAVSKVNRSGVLNLRGIAPSLIADAKLEAEHTGLTLKEFVAAALEREVQWRKEKRGPNKK
jgi:predicted HicB family RNase H-like nuclease